MENTNQLKIYSQYSNQIALKATPGHFATSSSHINYYIDITTLKTRSSEAKAVAKAMVQDYVISTVIDTIICLDGTDIIGAYLADELMSAGFMSSNTHDDIYVLTPEQNSAGQLIFRENHMPMIRGKNTLVLLASATTVKTLRTALECIEYYGGTIVGVSSIFSAAASIHGVNINSLFTSADIPGYDTYTTSTCPLCKASHPIDAIVNSFGYAKL